jgi:OOP family OmpA-OmpF porin
MERLMMRKGLIAAAGLSIFAVAAPGYAADNGIYLGAAVGQSKVEAGDSLPDFGNVEFDADATGYKLILGWRPLDWLAIEGNYVDLGSGDDDVLGEKIESDVDGISLSAIGFLPVGPVDLYARLGVINWDAELTAPSVDVRSKDDGTDLEYGVGAQFRLLGLSLRAEYERFEIADTDKVDLLSLGLTYTFL